MAARGKDARGVAPWEAAPFLLLSLLLHLMHIFILLINESFQFFFLKKIPKIF